MIKPFDYTYKEKVKESTPKSSGGMKPFKYADWTPPTQTPEAPRKTFGQKYMETSEKIGKKIGGAEASFAGGLISKTSDYLDKLNNVGKNMYLAFGGASQNLKEAQTVVDANHNYQNILIENLNKARAVGDVKKQQHYRTLLQNSTREKLPSFDITNLNDMYSPFDNAKQSGEEFATRMDQIANEAGTPDFMKKVAEGLGGFAAQSPLFLIGGQLAETTKLPALARSIFANPKVFPTIGKYIAPFIANTLRNIGTFGLPAVVEGETNPSQIVRDSAIFSILPTFLKNEKMLNKVLTGSGDSLLMGGMALLDGADLKDAGVAAVIGGVMGVSGMLGERSVGTPEQGLVKLKAIAKQVIKTEPGTPRAIEAQKILDGSMDKIVGAEALKAKAPKPTEKMKPFDYSKVTKPPVESSTTPKTAPEPTIKPKVDNLSIEARKYKSAEEFVKSQSLYHGTPNELEGGALKFGAGKQLKKGGYMGGHFLTDTPEIADNFSFGGKVYQASGEIKNKVLDVNKNKKLFEDFIGKQYLSDGEKIKFTKQDFDYMFPDGKADWSTINTDLLEQIAKKQGKIGVAIPEYAGGKQGMTYQLFEDNIPVKTKQELTDIWNKSQPLQEGASPLIQEAKKYKSAEEFVNNIKNNKEGGQKIKNLYSTGNVPAKEINFGRTQDYLDNKLVKKIMKDMQKGKPIEPVILRPTTNSAYGNFEVVDGNHRLVAAQKLGIDIPVLVENPLVRKLQGMRAGELEPLAGQSLAQSQKSYSSISKHLTKLTDIYNKAVGETTVVKPKVPLKETKQPIIKTKEAPKTETKSSKIAKSIETKIAEKSPKANEEFKSRVFERMKAEHPQIEGELGYDPIKLKADAKKAVELIAKNKQEAFDRAMGKKDSPDITSTALNIALSEKALSEGNYDLYSKLVRNRSLEQTRRGQEISAERGSVSDNGTSRYVKELIANRLDKLGDSYLGNLKETFKKSSSKEKATAVIDGEVAKLKEKIRTKKLDTKTALSLLDKFACV